MSSSFAVSRGVAKTIAARTLFLKVVPSPKTLTERRAVLRTLNKFGPVKMFKRLELADKFISLMAANETAATAIASSPVKVSVSNTALHYDDSMIHRWTSSNAPTFTIEMETNVDLSVPDPPDAPENLLRSSFIVHIFPNPAWPHKRMIQSSPLHGVWARYDGDRGASYVSADLAEHIPLGIATEGLKTWDLESLRYSHNILFYHRRISRRDFSYPGAVPELMSNSHKMVKEAGLLGQAEFASYGVASESIKKTSSNSHDAHTPRSPSDFYTAFKGVGNAKGRSGKPR